MFNRNLMKIVPLIVVLILLSSCSREVTFQRTTEWAVLTDSHNSMRSLHAMYVNGKRYILITDELGFTFFQNDVKYSITGKVIIGKSYKGTRYNLEKGDKLFLVKKKSP